MDYEKAYKDIVTLLDAISHGALTEEQHELMDSILRKIEPESEDERIRKWIVNFIEVRLPDAEEFEPEYRAALAYLEKQKEQKPAEWSEEDEKKISFLCGLLEHNLPEGTFAFGDGAKNGFILKQEAIEMLKSLSPQPHWKPSEAQMEALQVVIEHGLAIPNREASLAEGHIESLYCELKKLL